MLFPPRCAARFVCLWWGFSHIEHRLDGLAFRRVPQVRRYIGKMTGMSHSQVTRLIARYTAASRVRPTIYQRRRFAARYTRADIELLASVD